VVWDGFRVSVAGEAGLAQGFLLRKFLFRQQFQGIDRRLLPDGRWIDGFLARRIQTVEDQLVNWLAVHDVFLENAFQLPGVHVVIPDPFWIDDQHRTGCAHAQAVGQRADDTAGIAEAMQIVLTG
jgi:hypothetical protein